MKILSSQLLDEKCYVINHFSGLDIYVIPKKLTTTYALLGTKFGSLDVNFIDKSGNLIKMPNGVAHYLEHKMFENEDGGDTFEKFARYGASANAYTSFLETRYLFSTSDNFEVCLETLLDFVTHPYFTDENVEKERGIIEQEIRMYKDNPSNDLFYTLMGLMYKDHPIRTEISGSVKSISNITKEILYDAYNTFYSLDNMVLCISGDVDPKTVEKIADKMLKRSQTKTLVKQYPKEDARVSAKLATIYAEVSEPMFYMGIKDVDISDDPKVRLRKSIIMDLMIDCMFSVTDKFSRELYESGEITSNLSFDSDHTKAFSFITLFASCDAPICVYEKIKAHIEDVKQKGIDKNIFEMKKRAAYGAIVSEFDSTEDIANSFMDDLFEDTDTFEYAETIRTITLDEVNSTVKKMFCEDYYALAVARPADQQEEK